jgi:metal-responsive CopG/Arc/MetJ family transcriptional regulator
MQSTRTKISVSLPRDLVARIDREARGASRSRSRVLEDWLRRASRGNATRELEEATVGYYDSLTADEDREDRALATALSSSARRLRIDDQAPRRRRSRRS